MAATEIDKVAVVGAGTMGPGMAATFARNGFNTALYDVNQKQLDKARGTIDFVYTTLTGGGFMTAEDADAGRVRITPTTELAAAIDGASFVVETVPEQKALKQQVFKDLEAHVGDDVILASNTSGIPITDLASVTRLPDRVVGMHWSNPPHLIPVIEVIRGERTSDETAQRTVELVERIGMVPAIVDRDIAGFVENRILYAIMREALHLLDEGVASAEAIDTITKWGIGYKLAVIGPLELLDMAGLAAGRLGIKTQGGLFDYTPERIQQLQQQRGRKLVATRKALSNA
jgi:5-formyl-3-hydroxy-2-methylpyridine 4-carboxylic acid 5-dehydrogenase